MIELGITLTKYLTIPIVIGAIIIYIARRLVTKALKGVNDMSSDKAMVLKCDKCNEHYIMKVQVKKYKGGIHETYFDCTECGHRYISHFTNRDIRKLQKRVKETRNKVIRDKLQKELKVKTVDLTSKMISERY